MPKTVRANDDDPRNIDDAGGDDTEGHSMLLDPSTARHLARSRDQEIERAARERQRNETAKKR